MLPRITGSLTPQAQQTQAHAGVRDVCGAQVGVWKARSVMMGLFSAVELLDEQERCDGDHRGTESRVTMRAAPGRVRKTVRAA